MRRTSQEAAAMAMIHSQSHLNLQSSNDIEDNDGSSSSGELLRGGGGGTASSGGRSLSSSMRRRSYGDVTILPTAGAGGAPLPGSISKPPLRHGSGRGGTTDDERAAESYFNISAVPGYVSLEDVIGDEALYRDCSRQPVEAAIRDPLVRAASRLYMCVGGRPQPQPHHRRQQSPGPMGTRRGSAMHGIVKKYVYPLQGFLAGIFCCCFMSRDPSATSHDKKGNLE